jgi:hypothetical protein
VLGSWQQILGQGGAGIEARVQSRTVGANLAVHVVLETLRGPAGSAAVLATNAYELGDDGWRMVLHHAAPAGGVERPARQLH